MSHSLPNVMVLFLIAGPGLGVHEHGDMIQNELGCIHLSATKLFEEELKQSNLSLVEVRQAYMNNDVIPNMFAAGVVANGIISTITGHNNRTIRDLRENTGNKIKSIVPPQNVLNTTILISGFPTTTRALNILHSYLPWLNISGYFFLECPIETLRNRLLAESSLHESIIHKQVAIYEENVLAFVEDCEYSPKHKKLLRSFSARLPKTKVYSQLKEAIYALLIEHCREIGNQIALDVVNCKNVWNDRLKNKTEEMRKNYYENNKK